MLRYMVGHNASHVREMADLAGQVQGENAAAYQKITDAVAEFEKGNEILASALKDLE